VVTADPLPCLVEVLHRDRLVVAEPLEDLHPVLDVEQPGRLLDICGNTSK
jgi:hypothetical protein